VINIGGTNVLITTLTAAQTVTPDGSGEVDTSTIQLTDQGSNPVTVNVVVTANLFGSPIGQAVATDSFAGSILGVGSTATFNGAVTGIGAIPQLTLVGNGQNTLEPTPTSAAGTLTNPYTVVQTLAINLLPGQLATFTVTTEVVAVPEPATSALALTGLPLIGLVWARLRRRRA
jgi:hypothetical protein